MDKEVRNERFQIVAYQKFEWNCYGDELSSKIVYKSDHLVSGKED